MKVKAGKPGIELLNPQDSSPNIGSHQHLLPLSDGGLHHRIMGFGCKGVMVLKMRGTRESLHIKEEEP